MLEKITKEMFGERVGSTFRVSIGEGDESVDLVLSELEERKAPGGYETFSLAFRGPLEPALEQRMFLFEHETLEPFNLFIVPIARDPDGMIYEAIVNRKVTA